VSRGQGPAFEERGQFLTGFFWICSGDREGGKALGEPRHSRRRDEDGLRRCCQSRSAMRGHRWCGSVEERRGGGARDCTAIWAVSCAIRPA